MRITLGTAKRHLSNAAQTTDLLVARINFACEELLYALPGTLDRVAFSISDGLLTLPREYAAVHGVTTDTVPTIIKNRWWEFLTAGEGTKTTANSEVIDLGDGFVTFADWTSPSYLKAVCVLDESAELRLKGIDDNNEDVRSSDGSDYIEGEVVTSTLSGAWSNTKFTSLSQVIKPETQGRVKLYASTDNTDTNPTLVAIYDPKETDPCWRRYRVPTNSVDATAIVALCQRRFEWVEDDDEVLPITNLGALKDAVLAQNFKDNNDQDRYNALMADALRKINSEHSRNNPASQYPPMINFRGIQPVPNFF